MSEQTSTTGRVYGGMTADERVQRRRERLIEAGIELFGTQGFRLTTLRGLVREARLAERYFYESFADTEAVLAAAYLSICEQVAGEVATALNAAPDDFATQARVGMRVFAEATVADPRRARIQLIEVVGVSEGLETVRRDVLRSFADISAARLRPLAHPGGLDPDIVGMQLVGAVNELLIDHVLGRLRVGLDTLVEHFVGIALVAGEAVARPPAWLDHAAPRSPSTSPIPPAAPAGAS